MQFFLFPRQWNRQGLKKALEVWFKIWGTWIRGTKCKNYPPGQHYFLLSTLESLKVMRQTSPPGRKKLVSTYFGWGEMRLISENALFGLLNLQEPVGVKVKSEPWAEQWNFRQLVGPTLPSFTCCLAEHWQPYRPILLLWNSLASLSSRSVCWLAP